MICANVYQREIPTLPKEISRKTFVREIFYLGYDRHHEYNTIMLAIQIGDFFVNYKGKRVPYIGWKRREHSTKYRSRTTDKIIIKNVLSNRDPKYDPHKIADILCDQIYSYELIYTATAIAADYNEDNGYNIDHANIDCNNAYVYKLQWEICKLLNFTICPVNYLQLIGRILCINNPDESKCNKHLAPIFWDLSKFVCLDYKLCNINPITVLLGIIILYKRGRLMVIKEHRFRKFMMIVKMLSYECETSNLEVIRAYIKSTKSLTMNK